MFLKFLPSLLHPAPSVEEGKRKEERGSLSEDIVNTTSNRRLRECIRHACRLNEEFCQCVGVVFVFLWIGGGVGCMFGILVIWLLVALTLSASLSPFAPSFGLLVIWSLVASTWLTSPPPPRSCRGYCSQTNNFYRVRCNFNFISLLLIYL